jgi:hypothetical protein
VVENDRRKGKREYQDSQDTKNNAKVESSH